MGKKIVEFVFFCIGCKHIVPKGFSDQYWCANNDTARLHGDYKEIPDEYTNSRGDTIKFPDWCPLEDVKDE